MEKKDIDVNDTVFTKQKKGRPKKEVVEQVKVAKQRGRPVIDIPLKDRRRVYDLKFSLKKYNLSNDDVNKVIEYINKLNADRVSKEAEAEAEDFTHPRVAEIKNEKKDN